MDKPNSTTNVIDQLDNTTSETIDNKEEEPSEFSGHESKAEKRLKQEIEYLSDIEKFYSPQYLTPSILEETPNILEKPMDFYKNLLNLISDNHQLNHHINTFLSMKTPDQHIRRKIIFAFWEFCEKIFKENTSGYTFELKCMLRYGMVVTSAVSPLLFDSFKRVDIIATSPISVYYVDEWLYNVGKGNISQSIIDEEAISEESLLISQQHKIAQLESQNDHQIQTAIPIDESMQDDLSSVINGLSQLQNRENTEYGFRVPFTKEQDNQIRNIRDTIKRIQQKNSQIESKLSNINSTFIVMQKAQQEINQIKQNNPNLQNMEKTNFDLQDNNHQEQQSHSKIIASEFMTIRQMSKMCVGKRGNHFPILYSNYFSGPLTNFAMRERVLTYLKEIETIDFTLFRKEIKEQIMRNFPLILLIPCYGNSGICWEPFDMMHRNTTAAKIAIPMYSTDLKKAIIQAVGDFRWQYEKEKAGHLWMEEGLTGWYFQWHNSVVKKGDIKSHFIQNYISWIVWESRGVQKLDKEVRGIFWRLLPFTHESKKKLVKRSPVYGELLKKDRNRELSNL